MTQMQRRPSWPDPWRCTVEVLVVSGCPGTELAVARIREATEALGIETNLRFVIIEGEQQAREFGFVGSPTVRVDGVDVEDAAASRPIGVTCRLYERDGVVERAPALALIQGALAKVAPLKRAAR